MSVSINNNEELRLKCAEFDGDSLADILRDMTDWAEEYTPNEVNVWAIDSPHYNSFVGRWYAYITFVYFKD